MTAYEKGIIWGNDNYRTIGALVNIALATGNVGREGGGVCRLGGHQEGYYRPSDAHVGRPATYVDRLLISGGGKVHHIWACDHYKTTLNAAKFKQAHKRRSDMVKTAMDNAAGGSREELVDAIVGAVNAGGLFIVDVDIIRSQIGENAHVILAACEANEMNLTSMNGERRMRLSGKIHGSVWKLQTGLPDRRRYCPEHGACTALDGQGRAMPTSSRGMIGRQKKTPSWMATTRAIRV